MAGAGLFGKMPAAGDFVSRGFSAPLCAGLDELLQQALLPLAGGGAGLRAVLEASPPLAVSVRPGALAASGFTGLWLPSRDRVGRAYPLCVGLETEAAPAHCGCWPSPALANALARVVGEASEAGGGPDELVARLPAADAMLALLFDERPFAAADDETVPAAAAKASHLWLQGPEPAMSASMRAVCSRLPLACELVGAVLRADGMFGEFFGSRSLAPRAPLAALFDGRWAAHGWSLQPAGAD